MNEHDSERIAGLLEQEGMNSVSGPESADVIVVNTCCIRENADNRFYGYLGRLKQKKLDRPETLIAVAGCLAQKDREIIREKADFVDVVFGTHNVHRIGELLDYARKHGPIVEILEEAAASDQDAFPTSLPAKRESDFSAWVTIQIGCDNSCAFCIVPAVRGPEISRTSDDIENEVRSLAESGVSEITLLGQNVNSYGRDLALGERKAGKKVRVRPRFAELLRQVSAVPGIERVRFTSPHPKDLLPETIEAMAQTNEVCEHLHLPLQSGSDRILSLMRRGYTAEKYLSRLNDAREAIADLAVSTDIIVGFPGETSKDFEDTLAAAAEAEFDSAFTFIFSPRPGTEAEKLEDRFIPHDVCVERFESLRVVLERSALLKNSARIGRTETILVEGPSAKDPTKLSGRTVQNKLLHFPYSEEKAGPLLPGSFVTANITDAKPYYLLGEMKEILSLAEPVVSKISLSEQPVVLLSSAK